MIGGHDDMKSTGKYVAFYEVERQDEMEAGIRRSKDEAF